MEKENGNDRSRKKEGKSRERKETLRNGTGVQEIVYD